MCFESVQLNGGNAVLILKTTLGCVTYCLHYLLCGFPIAVCIYFHMLLSLSHLIAMTKDILCVVLLLKYMYIYIYLTSCRHPLK